MSEPSDKTKIVVPVYKESKVDKQIPAAVFIENIHTFCSQYGIDNVIESLTNALNKFQFTESQFMKFKTSMQSKIPEIEKALELISHLKESDEDTIQCRFPLNDGIYCSAEAKKNDIGRHWRGANGSLLVPGRRSHGGVLV